MTQTHHIAKPGSVTLGHAELHWIEWGNPSGRPVLALHGWLDNAASFEHIAPLLNGVRLIALDLPGHGLSYHRQLPGTYNIWDDLLDLLALVDHFGWQTFAVIGHSRGGMIAKLLTATQPERVNQLVLLDSLFPPDFNAEDPVTQLANFLKGYSKPRRSPPTYESVQAAVDARHAAIQMRPQAATPICERGLVKDEGGRFKWRSDFRLTLASAFVMSQARSNKFVEAISCPNLIILAEQGMAKHDVAMDRIRQFEHIALQVLPGDHHFHLGDTAPAVAEAINQFLAQVSLP